MASFIIPRRFYRPASSHYYSSPDNLETLMDPWSHGLHPVSLFPARCHRPALSCSAAPVRRRRDLRRVLRENAFGNIAPVRYTTCSPYVNDDDDDFHVGIPVEYLHLLEHLSGGLGSEHQTTSHPRENCGVEGKQSSTPENKAEGKEQTSTSSASSSSLPALSTTEMRSTNPKSDNPKELTPADDQFGVSIQIGDYLPENVNVSVVGRKVNIRAKRDERDEESGLVRHSEVEYSFMAPENALIDTLTSSFDTDGRLSITAAKSEVSVRQIPIEIQAATSAEESAHQEHQTTEVNSDCQSGNGEAEKDEVDDDEVTDEHADEDTSEVTTMDVAKDTDGDE